MALKPLKNCILSVAPKIFIHLLFWVLVGCFEKIIMWFELPVGETFTLTYMPTLPAKNTLLASWESVTELAVNKIIVIEFVLALYVSLFSVVGDNSSANGDNSVTSTEHSFDLPTQVPMIGRDRAQAAAMRCHLNSTASSELGSPVSGELNSYTSNGLKIIYCNTTKLKLTYECLLNFWQ